MTRVLKIAIAVSKLRGDAKNIYGFTEWLTCKFMKIDLGQAVESLHIPSGSIFPITLDLIHHYCNFIEQYLDPAA